MRCITRMSFERGVAICSRVHHPTRARVHSCVFVREVPQKTQHDTHHHAPHHHHGTNPMHTRTAVRPFFLVFATPTHLVNGEEEEENGGGDDDDLPQQVVLLVVLGVHHLLLHLLHQLVLRLDGVLQSPRHPVAYGSHGLMRCVCVRCSTKKKKEKSLPWQKIQSKRSNVCELEHARLTNDKDQIAGPEVPS